MPSSDNVYESLPEIKESSTFTNRNLLRGRRPGKKSEFDKIRKILSLYRTYQVRINRDYELGDATKGTIYNYFTAGAHLSKTNLRRILLRYIACNTKPSTSRFTFYAMKMMTPLKYYFRLVSRRMLSTHKDRMWIAGENFAFLRNFAQQEFNYESMEQLLNRIKLWKILIKDEEFFPIGKDKCYIAFQQLTKIAIESLSALNVELLTRNFFTKFSQISHVLSSQMVLAQQFYTSQDWLSSAFTKMIDEFVADIVGQDEFNDIESDAMVIDSLRERQRKVRHDGEIAEQFRNHEEMLWRLSTFYMSIAVLLTMNNRRTTQCCLKLSGVIANNQMLYDDKITRVLEIIPEALAGVDSSIEAVRRNFGSMLNIDEYHQDFIQAFSSLSHDDDARHGPQTFSTSFRRHIMNVEEQAPRPHLFQALYGLVIESFSLSCYQDTFKIYLLIVQEFGDQGIAKVCDSQRDDLIDLNGMLKKCQESSRKISDHMRIMNSCKPPISINGDAAVKMTTQSKEIEKAFVRGYKQLEILYGEVQLQIELKSAQHEAGFGLSKLRRLLKKNQDKVQLAVNEQVDTIKEYATRMQQYVLSAYNANYENEGEQFGDQHALDFIEKEMETLTRSTSQRFIASLDSMPE
ncbi:hypothetical protein Psal073_01366 [Piscirickettsia salmonis]|uniref:hypothetical protein n=1 Tax=Piscirickettsia salmonis TaxID=1238 RepID=UPI0002FD6528|nr:hypothetical protein [Piscirickettsia salmonis]QGO66414.1 hypothetical protein Psal073_01366 [Piscirickettsia salmonis]